MYSFTQRRKEKLSKIRYVLCDFANFYALHKTKIRMCNNKKRLSELTLNLFNI